ncbi:ribosomal protein S5 domain 2-type protein [Blyttiomyces helicus]|uniref:Ribosomal RNA-processing protein 43 n=1 Tax=Blyttiomyces helicus TaxID=388810 RepID=A0A4P9WCQ5_9FUNG|nr:ribosomal protein S5 domain 2-type protein [Blyttiomyces helicus]|eukprot:RKO89445.1 ribosomal protein S5 domain 2-type protein [Blyttiomyces helicus]
MQIDPPAHTPGAPAAAAATFSLDPETFKKVHPAEYHRRFLSQNVRSDGRPLDKFRKALVNVGSITTAHGSAMVRLGHTTVVCGIKAEVAEPRPATPKEGYLIPNVDLPALCSPLFRPGPPGELAQTVSEYINRLVNSSKVLNLEDLCIASGAAVWALHADIVCLNYEGNILDAALIALMAALRNLRLPTATYHESESTVHATEHRPIALVLDHFPVAATFGTFDGHHILYDPTDEEEPLLGSQITIVVDGEEGMCGLLKPGGAAMTREVLERCTRAARDRCADVSAAIDLALAAQRID